MLIRLAEYDDIPSILAINNHYVLHSWANFAVDPESLEAWQREYDETHELFPWFVADETGAAVGFGKASPWHGRCAYAYTAEITVYVKPDQHGKGVGRALYDKLLPTLTAQGYHTVIGAIAQPNEASVRLHESFGLVHSGTFPRVGRKFDQWHDVGYWVKQLQPPDTPPSNIKPVRDVVE
jgi:phosphinothricin acetyltransferase